MHAKGELTRVLPSSITDWATLRLCLRFRCHVLEFRNILDEPSLRSDDEPREEFALHYNISFEWNLGTGIAQLV
jgi:hypothetical protein